MQKRVQISVEERGLEIGQIVNIKHKLVGAYSTGELAEGRWSRGYDARLTRERSRVRFPFFLLSWSAAEVVPTSF